MLVIFLGLLGGNHTPPSSMRQKERREYTELRNNYCSLAPSKASVLLRSLTNRPFWWQKCDATKLLDLSFWTQESVESLCRREGYGREKWIVD